MLSVDHSAGKFEIIDVDASDEDETNNEQRSTATALSLSLPRTLASSSSSPPQSSTSSPSLTDDEHINHTGENEDAQNCKPASTKPAAPLATMFKSAFTRVCKQQWDNGAGSVLDNDADSFQDALPRPTPSRHLVGYVKPVVAVTIPIKARPPAMASAFSLPSKSLKRQPFESRPSDNIPKSSSSTTGALKKQRIDEQPPATPLTEQQLQQRPVKSSAAMKRVRETRDRSKSPASSSRRSGRSASVDSFDAEGFDEDLNYLKHMFGDENVRPCTIFKTVNELRASGMHVRDFLNLFDISCDSDVSNSQAWGEAMHTIAQRCHGIRPRLEHFSTIDDVVQKILHAEKIVVVSGAGISVSCGIPDFRSKNGLYARLKTEYPQLREPTDMFNIKYFKSDQRPFYSFAKDLYPGNFKPSPTHYFIRLLENAGRLLCNFTQNIDTLETVAGINKVVSCHGSFATASCMFCHRKVDCLTIKPDIMAGRIPRCTECKPPSKSMNVMKPDIVFFGEQLPDEFHDQLFKAIQETDLVLVMGSSLEVAPVNLIPEYIPDHVPQVLINMQPLEGQVFDVELLGEADIIIQEICHRLSEYSVEWDVVRLRETLFRESIYSQDLIDENSEAEARAPSPVHFEYDFLPPNRYRFKLSEE